MHQHMQLLLACDRPCWYLLLWLGPLAPSGGLQVQEGQHSQGQHGLQAMQLCSLGLLVLLLQACLLQYIWVTCILQQEGSQCNRLCWLVCRMLGKLQHILQWQEQQQDQQRRASQGLQMAMAGAFLPMLRSPLRNSTRYFLCLSTAPVPSACGSMRSSHSSSHSSGSSSQLCRRV